MRFEWDKLQNVPDCPTCGAKLDEGVQFCPRDGTTILPPAPAAPAKARASETTPLRKAAPAADAEVAADPLIGRLLDGRYRVRARLGQGGVGAVYEGEHVEMKRTIALKVLHAMFAGTEEFRKRFEREARAASRLSHPACVQVLDFGRVARVEPPGDAALVGMPYLVMEFVRGKTLIDVVESGGLAPREAVYVARGVLAALAHAHAQGLVHRDIKPANIMLLPATASEPMRVKLLDFGLAKDVEVAPGDALTQAGMVFGTPGYLSPEQAAGKPADTRADLYALGVVLFELCCRRRLFPRPDPLDVVRAHLGEQPDAPRSLTPSLSPELEAAILRALQKDPAARFASAQEMDAALAACPEGKAEDSAAALQSAAKSGQTPVAKSNDSRSENVQPGGSANLAVGQNAAPAASVTPAATAAPAKPKSAPAASGKGLPPWLSARVLAAGGVAAALLVTVIVIFARGKPAPEPAAPAPVAAAPSVPLAASARRHLDLAVDYQRKLWCSDAVEELDRALRDDARVRSEPGAARTAIACLTPKTQAKAIQFLVEKLGDEARAPLTAAAASNPNADIRHGAERALERLR